MTVTGWPSFTAPKPLTRAPCSDTSFGMKAAALLFLFVSLLAFPAYGGTFYLHTARTGATYPAVTQFNVGEPLVFHLDYFAGYDASRMAGTISKGNGETIDIVSGDQWFSVTSSYSSPGAYTVNFTGYGEGLGYFDPNFPTTPIWGAMQPINFDYDILIVPEPSMRSLLAFLLGAGALAFRRQILSRALPAISAS